MTKEDWQLDIDDDNRPIGTCPHCGGEARQCMEALTTRLCCTECGSHEGGPPRFRDMTPGTIPYTDRMTSERFALIDKLVDIAATDLHDPFLLKRQAV